MLSSTRIALWGFVCALVFAAVYGSRMHQEQSHAQALLLRTLHRPADVPYHGVLEAVVPYGGNLRRFTVDITYTPGIGATYETEGPSNREKVFGHVGPKGSICYTLGTPASATFPGQAPISEGKTALLLANYQPVIQGHGRVAGRPVTILALEPRHPGRPHLTLWVDDQTYLPLRIVRTSPGNGRSTQSEFTKFAIGSSDTSSSEPVLPKVKQNISALIMLSPKQLAARVGFSPALPQVTPPGFKLAASGIYHCPCGCGMKSAVLRYSDGLASYSVFQTAQKGSVCHSAECAAMRVPGNCEVGTLAGSNLAGIVRGNLIVAVIGDLTPAEARRIALSVPGAPFKSTVPSS